MINHVSCKLYSFVSCVRFANEHKKRKRFKPLSLPNASGMWAKNVQLKFQSSPAIASSSSHFRLSPLTHHFIVSEQHPLVDFLDHSYFKSHLFLHLLSRTPVCLVLFLIISFLYIAQKVSPTANRRI